MKVITFFSYKGGSCRTSTAFNTIPFISKKLNATPDKPILIIDMDIDSVGMSYLLKQTFTEQNDFVHLLKMKEDFSLVKTNDFSTNSFLKLLKPVGEVFGMESKSIYFLGVCDSNRYDDVKDDKDGIMENIREVCENNGFKAIIIDSAAGNQYVAGLATTFCDSLVCCMRPTTQFREGTRNYLEAFLNSSGHKTQIFIVPTAVPQGNVTIDGDNYPEATVEATEVMCEQIKNKFRRLFNRNPALQIVYTEEVFGIPEVTRFKYKEANLFMLEKTQGIDKLTNDEKIAFGCYNNLAGDVVR